MTFYGVFFNFLKNHYMKNEYVKFLFQPELFWLFYNKQYYYFLKNNITGGDKESNFEVDLTPNIS